MEGSEPDQLDLAPAWVTLGKFHNLCFPNLPGNAQTVLSPLGICGQRFVNGSYNF